MKKLKESRAASFVAIFIIYVAATAAGVAVYRFVPLDFWARLLLADVGATVFTFVFSLVFKNASVYDPYWSVQPPVILAAFALFTEMNTARFLLLVAVFFWAIRLTANWAYTFRGLCFQDWRYTMLREKTGALYPIVNFFGIHMVPTLIVYACTLPAVFVFVYDTGWNAGSIVFFALSLCAALLQGIADVQMHVYRKEKSSPFIRTGLWKYSRHPNYLGEILMWWGVGLSAFCVMPDRPYLLAGAVLNTLLFLFISIPMADKRQARKEGFDEYKKATRALLPIKK